MSKACLIFQLSQTCYHYKARLDEQNKMITDWLLKLNLFRELEEVEDYTTIWQHFYNHERPHMSVNGKPPKFKQ